jgi:hypothetical protein
VWAVVGNTDLHAQALQNREAYRQRTSIAIAKARTVDKTFLAQDFQSGLIPNRVFAHQNDVRGSQDFVVDDTHGGYKTKSF